MGKQSHAGAIKPEKAKTLKQYHGKKGTVYIYLLLAEFSVRTVNYRPSFFHRFMVQARCP